MEYALGTMKREDMTADPAKYPQGYFKDKPCRNCGELFSPLAPSNLYCSQPCADTCAVRRYLDKTYGLTLEQYNEIYRVQNGKCAICKEEGFTLNPKQKLKIVVDHCHKTGRVRGMLCHNCNRALGLLQDKVEYLQTAIGYLEGATTIPYWEYTESSSLWKRTTRRYKKS